MHESFWGCIGTENRVSGPKNTATPPCQGAHNDCRGVSFILARRGAPDVARQPVPITGPSTYNIRVTHLDIATSGKIATMIDPDEALRLVLQQAVARPARTVPLVDACGLQLAEPITADRDYPPFPRAMMDGYAVAVGDAGGTVDVLGEIAAGQDPSGSVRRGCCYEIMTGAPCPPGAEAVVQKEQVHRSGNVVTLPERIDAGQHIAPRASECPAGRTVLHPGQTISPLGVAVMASCGKHSVRVLSRPEVAVITTGTELVQPGTTPKGAQIRDSNGPMLVALACDLGLDRPRHHHADDRLDSLLDALSRSAEADVVLLTGGVSVGNYDLVPKALERFGAEAVFHKVRQKPGKPLLLARKAGQLLFGLPGNPLAGHFCFHRYVAAAVRQMVGKPSGLQTLQGELVEPVDRKTERTYFVAAHAEHDGVGWRLRPLPGVSSADVFASCPANCYVEVPPGHGAAAEEILPFTWIGNAPWPN